ncbi:MAG: MaoC family dehydratase [Pseudomonadota bacterium]
MTKTVSGNFFEDFSVGQTLRHATPRTITAGDVALYNGLYGSRFALQSSDEFARSLGLPSAPVDDWLVFHMVFGKSVPDISLNAVANLGYANGIFHQPVFPGDTLSATSSVTGVKLNSNGKTGVVYVDTVGQNQRQEPVLTYSRWVMVHCRDTVTQSIDAIVPNLAASVSCDALIVPRDMHFQRYDHAAAGSSWRWDDYDVGEKIDHRAGVTIEEAEHQLATRLYQNTAKVHFDQHAANDTRFGRRLVYGGHIISMARALSFNGLENAQRILAINGGTHANPSFAGDTIYAYSEILEKAALPNRSDIGALRVRLVAVKNAAADSFPLRDEDGRYAPEVVLDLDVTVAVPR